MARDASAAHREMRKAIVFRWRWKVATRAERAPLHHARSWRRRRDGAARRRVGRIGWRVVFRDDAWCDWDDATERCDSAWEESDGASSYGDDAWCDLDDAMERCDGAWGECRGSGIRALGRSLHADVGQGAAHRDGGVAGSLTGLSGFLCNLHAHPTGKRSANIT